MYTRIVVPLDGSALAEQALVDARQLATKLEAPLHLVRVVDVTRLERYGAYGLALEYAGLAEVAAEEERQARDYLAEQASTLAAANLTVTTGIGRGLVVPVIAGLTKPGDLIVMASHGRSGISRWFLGSVAEELVRRSAVPVLIVRATAASA